jgi:hypothetical protein
VGSSVIPFTVRRGTTPTGELVLTILTDCNGLDFRADGENLKADLKIAVADRAADGSTSPHFSVLAVTVPAAKWETARAEGVSFRRQWTPVSDVSTIRVIVLDLHTGRYGSVDVPPGKFQ